MGNTHNIDAFDKTFLSVNFTLFKFQIGRYLEQYRAMIGLALLEWYKYQQTEAICLNDLLDSYYPK